MKTKLILAGVIAFTSLSYAQNTAWPAPAATSNVGLGTSSPAAKLQVSTATGNDGITVTQLSTGSNGSRVLLENKTSGGHDWGIYSLGNGNNQGTGNFLIHDQTSGVNKDRFFISGSTGFVGIGTIAPNEQLHSVGTYVGVRGDGGSEGVAGNGIGSNNMGGVVGVAGRAYDGANNKGGYFLARDGGSGVTSYGVYSEIINPLSLTGGIAYAIYADAGGIPLGGLGPKYAGYFNGDVVTAGGFYFYSDKGIKKDIKEIDNSLSIIKRLNPVNYRFNTEENTNLALPAENQYGFISQEVRQILPEFTKTLVHPAKLDENGKEIAPKREILGLNYQGFIALLTKGIQEQEARIDELERKLDEQGKLVAALSGKPSDATGINSVNTMESDFQMSQNVPNPFTHETVVKYTLPQTISSAFMAVYDLTGKQITTFPITERGSSSLTITSEKLSAGIYIYSIVADGKVVDSKRMIVAEK